MADGFALRQNGTCPAGQQDCGITVAPYHVCCPVGSFCPQQYNVACCATETNCTQALVRKPACADPGWDLYDNNGFFCCPPGRAGYATPGNTDGCAAPGYSFRAGERLLSIVSSAQASATSTSTPGPSTASPSPTTTPTADEPGLTRSGKLALGLGLGLGLPIILAALAAVFWWLRRRRARPASSAPKPSASATANGRGPGILSEADFAGSMKKRHEAPVTGAMQEAPDTGKRREAPAWPVLPEAPGDSGVHEAPDTSSSARHSMDRHQRF